MPEPNLASLLQANAEPPRQFSFLGWSVFSRSTSSSHLHFVVFLQISYVIEVRTALTYVGSMCLTWGITILMVGLELIPSLDCLATATLEATLRLR